MKLRLALLLLLLLGLLGTGAELLLVGHTEGFWQLVPLVLIAAALVLVAWSALRARCSVLRALQAVMALSVAAGLVGLFQHYQANAEFELEMYPSLRGFELFWKAIQGASPPTLAPGAMILLGLLGLVCTYRHPVSSAPIELNLRSRGDAP